MARHEQHVLRAARVLPPLLRALLRVGLRVAAARLRRLLPPRKAHQHVGHGERRPGRCGVESRLGARLHAPPLRLGRSGEGRLVAVPLGAVLMQHRTQHAHVRPE